MKLPKTLFVGHLLLKRSRAVSKKETDEEALGFFQSVLNKAQPVSKEELIQHQLIKSLYNENKSQFLSFIRNTRMESLILWTEARAIVSHFGLRGSIYAKWTGKDTMYDISVFQSTRDNTGDSAVHPIVLQQRLAESDDGETGVEGTEARNAIDESKELSMVISGAVSELQPNTSWADMVDDK
jgi:hypothetical protein